MNLTRINVSLVVAGMLLGVTPTAAHAAGGQGAQTRHQATETFFDTVPCASDTGFFKISLRFNSVEKIGESGGHFTQTGRFTAVPVTPTKTEVEDHDGHQHEHVVAADPREGASYSGRFTASGTLRLNERVTVETFVFRVQGTSTTGDRINAHALFHSTTVEGDQKALIEGERCN